MNILKSILEILFLSFLISASYYDIKSRRIPNLIILWMLISALLHTFFTEPLIDHLLGFIFPSSILLLLNFTFKRFIGNGDIKLFMATGLLLGYWVNIIVFILSCLLCIIFTMFCKLFFKKTIILLPFAPFVSLSVLLYIIWQNF